jgi:hypothetical protein
LEKTRWWQILTSRCGGRAGSPHNTSLVNPEPIPVSGGNRRSNNGNCYRQQQINVRSVEDDFNSLGTLNAQDVVNLTGKDSNGAWLQIAFTTGPDGKGWVNAAFVRAQGVENLPIITEAGQVVGTGTPTASLDANPTGVPAWADNDSPGNPIVNVIFEPNGTHTLIYTGDISSPEGDSEDWIIFRPHTGTILVSLTCTGTSSLQVDILENGMPTNSTIRCGDNTQDVGVTIGSSYSVHLYTQPSGSALQYVEYTIKIQTSP